MKLMIASDIHGSSSWCAKLIRHWRQEGKPRLVLLGDLLYHGPRNDLPDDYSPQAVSWLLNDSDLCPLCVRGNCEAEVDQMMLAFPVMADYAALLLDGHMIFATHGHRFNQDNPPPLRSGDVLLCGHTHVPGLRRCENFIYLNPGSVSLPKEDSPHSFMLLEDGEAIWKDLKGGIFDRQRLWED